MEVSKHTAALIKKSNELAAIVSEIDERKTRAWNEYHETARKACALEDKILAGDMSSFEEWKGLRRKIHVFIHDDSFSEPLRKAREAYNEAHKNALVALRADVGLVWTGWD